MDSRVKGAANPSPGPWMETLKKVLAFPMYGAAAWLLWVLTLQAGSTALAALLAAAVAVGLAAWLFGAAQAAQANGRRPAALYALSLIVALIAASTTVAGLSGQNAAVATADAATQDQAPTQPFSSQRLADLRAQGKAVFVNFTAAWCITCQVNERVALSGARVAKAFARSGAIYLKADWTRRDADIARTLAEHGRAGVPLYLVYGAGGGAPKVLPQLLTQDIVVKALDDASRPRA